MIYDIVHELTTTLCFKSSREWFLALPAMHMHDCENGQFPTFIKNIHGTTYRQKTATYIFDFLAHIK